MPKEKKEKKAKENDVLEQLKKLAKEHKKGAKNASKTKGKEKKYKEIVGDNKSNSMTPMTKEDYDKKRSAIKTVYDEQTGRMRRVRETGEILETIVTREQHQQINKTATHSDGLNYLVNSMKK